jgi:predicted MPP superfamily phosphohydrolase
MVWAAIGMDRRLANRPGAVTCVPFMRKIIPAILTLLLATTLFAAWTFSRFERLEGRAWMAIPLLLVASFFPATMLSHRIHARWLSALNVASGISVGFLSYFVLAAALCWVVLGASRLAGMGIDGRAVAAWAFGAASLVGLFALGSAYWVRVTRITVRLRHLPRFWNGRSLALVSDIHLGNFRGAAFSRQVVARLSSLAPEMILVGGDMFDGVRLDLKTAVAPWSALSAPSGVYFVGGNHDDYGGRNAYFQALRGVGMRVLDNEKVEVHGLQLVGVHDRETHSPEVFGTLLAKAGLDTARASILLAHRPENLAVPEAAGISLQLSGHTHRGQFWPWTLIARRVHRDFAYGLNRFGGMAVFTSSGAGTWGPPFRLGTRSEVVLIRLEEG